MPSMSLPLAIRKYLALPGETASDLMRQIRELTDKDKDDLVGYFNAQGIEGLAHCCDRALGEDGAHALAP